MNNSTEGETAPPTAVHRLLPRSQGIVYVAAFVIEALVTVIGNLVVLAVFGKNRQLRQRKSHWLLINQAAVDLLAGLIVVPSGLYYSALNFDLWHVHMDHPMHLALDAITIPLAGASLLNLLLIALERTYATLRPIKHRTISAKDYRVAIAVDWFLPVLLAICPRVAWYFDVISPTTFYYIRAVSGFGIFLLVVSSYVSIWIKFLKRSSIAPHNDLRAAQERKLTAYVFLVTAASFATYLPASIAPTVAQVLYGNNIGSFSGTIHTLMCSLFLVCVNYWINPIIYSFKMPGFRRAAVRLICGNRPRTANAVLPLQTVRCDRGNGLRL